MTAVVAWLGAAQARADAATPGPWRYTPDTDGNPADGPTRHTVLSDSREDRRASYDIAVTDYDEMGYRDAAFIAAARTDLPAALAALREALRYLDDPDERLMGHSSPAVYVEPLRHAIASALGVSES